MKIGVISDTHLDTEDKKIPPEILEAFKKVDMIIHAGDLVDLKVIERLRSVCKDVRAVFGNMDPENVRKKLPEINIISAGKFKIGVMHGRGHPSGLIELLSERFKDKKVDVIIFGHSHVALNEKRGDCIFFNPGSATDKIFASQNSYGIIEINDTIQATIINLPR